jgi:hypothetical protein
MDRATAELIEKSRLAVAESERWRKRRMRNSKIFAAVMCVIFFGSYAGILLLANAGRIDLVEQIGIVVGAVAIVFGVSFIIYLLTRPPFSTGETMKTVRLIRAQLKSSFRQTL